MKRYDKAKLPRILWGNGQSARAGSVVKEFGVTKALVVTGPHVRQLDCFKDIVKTLDDNGISYEIYDKTVNNPPDYACLELGEVIKSGKYDGVLAIGGGSVMDSAKAGALLAGIPEKIETDEFHAYRRGGPKARSDWKRPYPLITVVTTSGTSAEATGSAVVTSTKLGLKFSFGNEAIIPDVAIIDPVLTLGAPHLVTANTGLDALAHAVEDIVGCAANEYSNPILLACVERVWKWLPIALEEPNDLEAREQLSWAAHNALTNAGIPNGHAVAHAISGLYHLVHGHACALVLPTVIRHHAETSQKEIADIANVIGVPVTGDARLDADRVAKALVKFYKATGLPNLKDAMREAGYDDDRETFIRKMIPFVLDDYKSTTWNPPIHESEEACGAICGQVYDEE